MFVQDVFSRPSTMWVPIHSHRNIAKRIREGRFASKEFTGAVTSMLSRASELPPELVAIMMSQLRFVEQESPESDGVVRQLGADIGLKTDPAARTLCLLKQSIDDAAIAFREADAARGYSPLNLLWSVELCDVPTSLTKATEGAYELPRWLSQQIDDLIHEFKSDLEACDWQGCCESMAALDRLICRQLVASPDSSLSSWRLPPRPEVRPCRPVEKALADLRASASFDIYFFDMTKEWPGAGKEASRLVDVVTKLQLSFSKSATTLPATTSKLISEKIDGLESAVVSKNADLYGVHRNGLRQLLMDLIHEERRQRRQ